MRRAATVIMMFAMGLGASACNDGPAPDMAEVMGDGWVRSTGYRSPSSNRTSSDLYDGPEGFEKYVQKFVDDAKAQGRDVMGSLDNPRLEIRVASLDDWGSSVVGLCQTAPGLRRVTFDPDFWNTASETRREILAHHEFGHCLLSRAHRTATLSSGIAASIMFPTIPSATTYLNNYDYYQEELFTWGTLNVTHGDSSQPQTHVCDNPPEEG